MVTPSPAPRLVIVIARIAHAAFFLLTSTYCLLTYNPFAYQQFIKPHLVNWLSGFVVWHHLGFWLVLALTGLTMARELGRRPGQAVGGAYLALSVAVGGILLVRPVLPRVDNDGLGLVLAAVSLGPPIWLAIYDHRVTTGSRGPCVTSETQLVAAFLLAGFIVWLEQAIGVPWRLEQTGEIRLASSWVGFGLATSALAHLVAFTVLLVVTLVAMRAGASGGRGGAAQYWLLVALSGLAIALAAQQLVFDAISFRGPSAWGLSALLGVTLALLWSSMARRLADPNRGDDPGSAMDLWLTPLPAHSRRAAATAIVGSGAAGYALLASVMTFDWDFLVQRLCVLALWFTTFGFSFRVVRGWAQGPSTWPWVVAPASIAIALVPVSAAVQPRLAGWIGDPRFVAEFALDGYVAVDPSFRLIRHVLRTESADDRAFYPHLRANTALHDAALEPVDLDFVRPLAAPSTRPHIFLFIVDSLRRDYVSAYNPRVHFTPSLGRFGGESFVFERAFARYGGTGLAIPALWTGGMVIHKQYVTPYARMNTLEKLLDAGGYRKALSLDHITRQIVRVSPPPPGFVELDRGRAEMRYDFCATLGELSGWLTGEGRGSGPVFAHTRSLNLHIAHVRKTPVRPGASYPGFLAPVAASVERMDACFGAFVDTLKREGLYDRSVIVVTSDHGDSLGESLRWGHSYTLYPEVVRIPLIIRIPPALAEGLAADEDAVSFSTDIAPTLYALLGQAPRNLGPLFGESLVRPAGADASARRHQPYLLASSYGAVYAVLRDNGQYLYIADGVNDVDYAYAIGMADRERVGISLESRTRDRAFIRQQLDELARVYRLVRP